jgi:hypothetical protein
VDFIVKDFIVTSYSFPKRVIPARYARIAVFVVSGPSADRQVDAFARLGEHAEVLGRRPAADHALLLLDAEWLLVGADRERLRAALERSRRHQALIALDLGTVEWVRALGGSMTAYHLAAVQPDVLFASEESTAEVAAPLEGIASMPVIIGRDVCTVHGRRLAVPSGADLDHQAFVAAFCVALVEGAAPVEAVGRAVLAAATRSAA